MKRAEVQAPLLLRGPVLLVWQALGAGAAGAAAWAAWRTARALGFGNPIDLFAGAGAALAVVYSGILVGGFYLRRAIWKMTFLCPACGYEIHPKFEDVTAKWPVKVVAACRACGRNAIWEMGPLASSFQRC